MPFFPSHTQMIHSHLMLLCVHYNMSLNFSKVYVVDWLIVLTSKLITIF